MIDELLPPDQKLVPLGYIVLQSGPLTEEEGKIWLTLVSKVLPSEIFTHYSFVPIIPGDSN